MKNPARLLLLPLLLVSLAGCSKEDSSDPSGTKSGAGTSAEDARRRCGDFVSEKEASELGLNDYRPNKGETHAARGVTCALTPVVISIFMSEKYDDIVKGAQKSAKALKELAGPKLGSKSYWFESYGNQQVVLVTSSGKYAMSISGEDLALVEKAAKLAAEGQ